MTQRRTTDGGGAARGAGGPSPAPQEAARAFGVTLGIALGLSMGLVWLLGAPESGPGIGLPALRISTATAWGLVILTGLWLLRR